MNLLVAMLIPTWTSSGHCCSPMRWRGAGRVSRPLTIRFANNHSMSSSLRLTSFVRPLTAPPRAGPGRFLRSLKMDAHVRHLRSEQYPDGLPTLQGRDLQRVHTDNQACEFILEEIRLLAERGGGSVRENPRRSLHWWGPTKRSMMDSGLWRDKRYDACCLGGARCKVQCLRHKLAIDVPSLSCASRMDTLFADVRSIPLKRRPNTQLYWLLLLPSLHHGGPGAWVAPNCTFLDYRNSSVSAPENTGWTSIRERCGNGRWRPLHSGSASIHQTLVKLPGSPGGLRLMTLSSRRVNCRTMCMWAKVAVPIVWLRLSGPLQ